MLDAARLLVLTSGVGSATVRAISVRAGAPMGTLYHRFRSRDGLLAAMWIRAARRSQAAFLAAIDGASDPVEAVVSGALSIFDFAISEREDAQLLVSVRREDLLPASPPEQRRELDALNRPIAAAIVRLSAAVLGDRSRASIETITFAVFDISYGAIRRHLVRGRTPCPAIRPAIEAAVRAAIIPAGRLPGPF